MKNLTYLTFLFLLCHLSVFGQNRRVSYHAADGQVVETPEESYFYRIISTDEQYPELRRYQEYYTKGDRLKLITRLTNGSMTMSRIGECRIYYPNGQLQEKQRYNEKNQPVDSAYTYYPNGTLYTKKFYKRQAEMRNGSEIETTKIEYIVVQDSLGNILVENGTGILPIYDLTALDLVEQGHLLDNEKDGEWAGKADKRTYVESWKAGRLVSGVIKDSLGLETKYDEKNFAVAPDYPGGQHALRNFVGKNYQYPPEAIRAGVAGTIQINFIVEADGSMSNFSVKKDLGYGTGEAAIKAIRKAKKQWSPGMKRGIPVRVTYLLPIVLNL